MNLTKPREISQVGKRKGHSIENQRGSNTNNRKRRKTIWKEAEEKKRADLSRAMRKRAITRKETDCGDCVSTPYPIIVIFGTPPYF